LAEAAREYELVLMLDPGREDVARDELAKEARAQIEAAGTLKHENNWGLRKMAYEIEQRTEADYRWFRFEAPTELLDSLNHNLRIADGVLRFRIFKVDPDAPVIAPPASAATAPAASRERPKPPVAPSPAAAPAQGPSAESPPAEAPVAETPPAEAEALESEEAVAETETAVAEPEEAPAAEAPAEGDGEPAPSDD
jgi:small subunit ribosomal protein S6